MLSVGYLQVLGLSNLSVGRCLNPFLPRSSLTAVHRWCSWSQSASVCTKIATWGRLGLAEAFPLACEAGKPAFFLALGFLNRFFRENGTLLGSEKFNEKWYFIGEARHPLCSPENNHKRGENFVKIS
jgi:hypothetical protein